MKKLIFAVVAMFAMAFVSCDNKADGAAQTTDSLSDSVVVDSVVDSLAVDSVVAE
jgi:predicted small secreted protein